MNRNRNTERETELFWMHTQTQALTFSHTISQKKSNGTLTHSHSQEDVLSMGKKKVYTSRSGKNYLFPSLHVEKTVEFRKLHLSMEDGNTKTKKQKRSLTNFLAFLVIV